MSYKSTSIDLWYELLGDAARTAPSVQQGTAIERLAWLTDEDRSYNRIPSPANIPVRDEVVTISASETRHGIIICSDFTLAAGATLTTGPLLILASGTVTINGTLNANERGFPSVNHGQNSGGTTGNGGDASVTRYRNPTNNDAVATLSSGVLWGLARQMLGSSMVPGAPDVLGGGSGGSGAANQSPGGVGVSKGGDGGGLPQNSTESGAGGGAIIIVCDTFNNTTSGSITANGGVGINNRSGGGGGGVVAVLARVLTRRGTVSATGGAGREAGGAGLVGFYHVATGAPL